MRICWDKCAIIELQGTTIPSPHMIRGTFFVQKKAFELNAWLIIYV